MGDTAAKQQPHSPPKVTAVSQHGEICSVGAGHAAFLTARTGRRSLGTAHTQWCPARSPFPDLEKLPGGSQNLPEMGTPGLCRAGASKGSCTESQRAPGHCWTSQLSTLGHCGQDPGAPQALCHLEFATIPAAGAEKPGYWRIVFQQLFAKVLESSWEFNQTSQEGFFFLSKPPRKIWKSSITPQVIQVFRTTKQVVSFSPQKAKPPPKQGAPRGDPTAVPTMANPTSAFFSAGPSLVPSPVTATTCL